ncbi:hypothetical protein [Methylobacterium iners]|uniref:hypothetical protein n=1 Tax=Methylobacterium iners TaxID=418707 RepID=UPI001EE18113|nr:hypothetical protein [Methylobacterium iners]
MFDLSREANALQDAMRVRAELRFRFHQLTELQTTLDAFLQSVRRAELGARSVGLREAVVVQATNYTDLDRSVGFQSETNEAFRMLNKNLNQVSNYILSMKITISKLDEAVELLREASVSSSHGCA